MGKNWGRSAVPAPFGEASARRAPGELVSRRNRDLIASRGTTIWDVPRECSAASS